jgi:hypothetical protein
MPPPTPAAARPRRSAPPAETIRQPRRSAPPAETIRQPRRSAPPAETIRWTRCSTSGAETIRLAPPVDPAAPSLAGRLREARAGSKPHCRTRQGLPLVGGPLPETPGAKSRGQRRRSSPRTRPSLEHGRQRKRVLPKPASSEPNPPPFPIGAAWRNEPNAAAAPITRRINWGDGSLPPGTSPSHAAIWRNRLPPRRPLGGRVRKARAAPVPLRPGDALRCGDAWACAAP